MSAGDARRKRGVISVNGWTDVRESKGAMVTVFMTSSFALKRHCYGSEQQMSHSNVVDISS